MLKSIVDRHSGKLATLLAAIGVGAVLVMGAPAQKASAASEGFTEGQKAEIGAVIRDYLLKNPELMIEVQRTLEAKMELARQENATKAIASNAAGLFKASTAPVAGDPNGDVTVVEFFDYNCGYCRKAMDDVAKLVSKDKKVKVVLAEFPIFGKRSEDVARLGPRGEAAGQILGDASGPLRA